MLAEWALDAEQLDEIGINEQVSFAVLSEILEVPINDLIVTYTVEIELDSPISA